METREKQAYLIEAHKCDEMLLTLLRMLDVPVSYTHLTLPTN